MAEKKEKIKLNEIVSMNNDLLNYLEADEIDEETFNDTKELILTELQNKGGTIVFARRQSENNGKRVLKNCLQLEENNS